MILLKSIVALSLSVSCAQALTVSSISDCPSLRPRTHHPKDVTDLRIDDIKMVAALGDSITAGFAMMGVDYQIGSGAVNLSLVHEYRGHSYSIGADKGAITLPNFIEHYQSKVEGGSVGSHPFSYCQGLECGAPGTLYRPAEDHLNSAQSGAIAMNLQFELDYLVTKMKHYSGPMAVNNHWKLITIQIGSNDQCASCFGPYTLNTTAEAYGNYVENAIKRIKKQVPRAVINLLGTFKVSRIYPLTAGQAYCIHGGIEENKYECGCPNVPGGLASMDAVSDAYNVKLEAIAKKYSGERGGDFAVMYSPMPLNISSFPVNALSNVDCFHPALKGHEWIAKSIWNQLFTKLSKKPNVMNWDGDLKILCPTSDDRLPTTNK